MNNLKAICVTERTITALYEQPNGERIAHEFARLGDPPIRRGTWQKNNSIYTVTFGIETMEIDVQTIAGVFAKTSKGANCEETWAQTFRREILGA